MRSYHFVAEVTIKGYIQYFFAILFISLKESTLETWKNIFYFTFALEIFQFWNLKVSVQKKKHILVNNFNGEHSLVMTFGQSIYIKRIIKRIQMRSGK